MVIREGALAQPAVSTLITSDAEVMRHALISTYGATKFETSSHAQFSGCARFYSLKDISLGFCGYGSKATVEFPEADFVRLQIALRGRAATTISGITTPITGNNAFVTGTNQQNRIDFEEDFEQVFLRINGDALERTATALVGAKLKFPIEFESAVNLDLPHLRSFQSLVFYLKQQFASQSIIPHFMLQELQHTVIVGLLSAVPHSYSRFLEQPTPDIGLAQVKLVEDYIVTNWNKAITVDRLASATGIGARTIFNAFRLRRGYTPLAFVKTIRLQKANSRFRAPRSGDTVTGIALECGFGNLGHFSRDYLERYGELPSITLKRQQSLLGNHSLS